MIQLTWWHLVRHWRLNLAVWLCLTLALVLAATQSGYTDAIAARELSQTWDAAAPSQRSVLVTGPRDPFTDKLYASLQEKLGSLLMDRMVIRHAAIISDPPDPADSTKAFKRLDVFSFDLLSQTVRVIEGKLPDAVNLVRVPEPWRPPPIEAVIGVRAAAQSGLRVGDQLIASGKYHRLNIVGIVEPNDPRADIWGEDLSAFETISNTPSLIIDSYSMQSYYPQRPIFLHEVSWRITLNPQRITIGNVDTLRSDLVNIQTQSATVRAVTHTGLVQILDDYLARLSRLRIALFLLTAQTLMFVLYTLTMLASFVVNRSHVELTTLSGRGASVWQITRLFALENLILAMIAMSACPALAIGVMRLWSDTSSIMLSNNAWMLAGVVAVLGWLTLVAPVFVAARRTKSESHLAYAQPPQPSQIQKRYLDLYLLAFGALLFWQLNQANSFVTNRLGNTLVADPILMIGPSLLLVGVAMVFLRLLPFLLRLVAWLAQNLQGATFSQSLLHLARDPVQSSQVVLLVSLTTGMILFTQTLENHLATSPETMGRYLADALRTNALALVLFSVMVFFMTHLFAMQERANEFGILRSMGLAFRQWLTWLMIEGMLVLFLGLMAGVVVGLGLSNIMIPYLSQALTGWQLGRTIEQATVNWSVVVQSYGLLIAVYGLALILLWLVLVRTRDHWTIHSKNE
ncbi:MAG: ABC transporter permease [Chloroflexi bacterium]|nr:ABC transporter permease [Chloroflexota bacterium]